MIEYAGRHRVEDLQAFTSGPIPVPQWVRMTAPKIPQETIDKAANYLKEYFGPSGIAQVGGEKWWQWRAKELKGEWIEMRSHFRAGQRDSNSVPKRTLLYVHGGAYFFSSVAVQRYQIQRHARKLNCSAFAPRYRLAPQYPFPCAVLDVLAAYLYLLDNCKIPADEILMSGDSAGGGLLLGLLCLIRDVGLPLPAGAMLISPWVDLMHSFPSIIEDGTTDYIPSQGFHHRPSLIWPAPTLEDLELLQSSRPTDSRRKIQTIDVRGAQTKPENTGFGLVKEAKGDEVSGSINRTEVGNVARINIDGKMIEVRDQIQLVAPNEMLDNPLLSPVTQASLGGLCPLLIV